MENQNKELEQMRQQLSLLNKKLSDQQIVNDRLMREAMKNKMSWIKKWIWGETVALPFIVLVYLGFKLWLGLSWGPFVMVALALVVAVVVDHRVNMIGDEEFLSADLKQTALSLARMKRLRMRYEVAAIPLMAVWLLWFIYDIYVHTPADGAMHDAFIGGMVGCLIGAVAGGVAGFSVYRKMQLTNDEIIRQIEALGE